MIRGICMLRPSTGKVESSDSSDGYFFVDAKDNKLKEVSGNCIITYESY